jgi:hypothetical protein
MDEPGKMHFRRMDEGTDADFAVLAKVHEENIRKLPALFMGLLTNLRGDEAYPVDRLQHSLQAATRADRDGRDEEYVVAAEYRVAAGQQVRLIDRVFKCRWRNVVGIP